MLSTPASAGPAEMLPDGQASLMVVSLLGWRQPTPSLMLPLQFVLNPEQLFSLPLFYLCPFLPLFFPTVHLQEAAVMPDTL